MESIYKILNELEWSLFQENNRFAGSNLDHKDHFMHASYNDQLPRIMEKFFPNQPVIVLKLDHERIAPHVKPESNKPGGDIYPHIYCLTLTLDHVVEVLKYDADHQLIS
jgi:uncharacterized protein (DUF952 family)